MIKRALSHIGEDTNGLPLGRRSPRGKLRWYLVRCIEGREDSTCSKVKRVISRDLLEDAFVPKVERLKKYRGEWRTLTRTLFTGYFVVVTKDAPALSRALGKLTFPVCMAGAIGRGWQPVAEDAQMFLDQCMDDTHTIRASEAEIVSDQLHVLQGPLKGRESRVSLYVRGKSIAIVRMGLSQDGFSLAMPLAIPVRR